MLIQIKHMNISYHSAKYETDSHSFTTHNECMNETQGGTNCKNKIYSLVSAYLFSQSGHTLKRIKNATSKISNLRFL